MLESAASIIGSVFLATAFIAALIAWFRAMINMLGIWRHVTKEALSKHHLLRWNRFNAIFVPEALDDEGKRARVSLLKNILVFVGAILLAMGYATWADLSYT